MKSTLIPLVSLFLISFAPSLLAQATQETREPEATTGIVQQQLTRFPTAMVSAAHPLASDAGERVLRAGGSAIDAAIATQLVLGLVEPQSSGIGGGAFILHWQADNQALTTFDGRETAPAAAGPYLFADHGKVMSWREAYVGGKSVGVPGVLKALADAHQRYGQLPWESLFTDAITLAEQGFAVSSRTSKQLAMGWNSGLKQLSPAKEFFYPNGSSLLEGATLKNPAYAALLRNIAKDGVSAFYQGENAEAMVKTVQQAAINPGSLALSDLANYQAIERDALCVAYRVYQVCGMAPPSSGGLAVLQMLGILEHFPLAEMQPNSAQAVHVISQASRLAFADRDLYVTDPAFGHVPLAGLLDPAYLKQRAGLISAQDQMATAGIPRGAEAQATSKAVEFPNTSHFSVVDAKGNAVSMTTSIENVFGSGLMVNGYLLNNQLTDFSLAPRDGELWVANRVEGGKRPRSSMAPMMVFDADNNLRLVIGSPGGSRIINYVALSIIAILDWDLDVQQAINLPRFTHRNDYLALEQGTPLAELKESLTAMGYDVRIQDLNSGLHAIEVQAKQLEGAADPRREGKVSGF
ncbi:gamma-glutamyltransferase [Alishewanella sp. SMS8]|uniref:gamma-glutamyltransferase n=1 Tax=Alishewanella sp. SMS8 TaxID=2994676 RepID=UPI002740AAF3|nr:gamma-glutamyltransferase [Alishewanella sp. SMS8]MDP5036499.1 gamma-glutamyltransferase [Alishewanella sp.]MDP5460212.1 gamma-glutamyltransferase [Alishewanella sp. SMS8]